MQFVIKMAYRIGVVAFWTLVVIMTLHILSNIWQA